MSRRGDAAELVLATRNAHKVREVGRILAPFGLSVVPLPDSVGLPPEDGDTFEANALGKARAASAALGRGVIADDSGIEAEALEGRPGVRSARYAGEDATDAENLEKLLAQAPAGSGLRYVCALAYVAADGSERIFHGYCRGRVAEVPRGQGGFGYDPAFVPEERPDGSPEQAPDGPTMAELSDADKDRISHRGRALRAFAEWYAGSH